MLVLGLSLGAASRERKTIQKSATNAQLRAADTFLDQSLPTTTNGTLPVLQVRSLSAQNQRTLELFDLSALPNVGVKSATMILHVLIPPAARRFYDAHRVTSFFTESGASWNIRAVGLPWGTPGGDFNPTRTSRSAVNTTGVTVAWNITADVRSWYGGAPNYGTLIEDSAENAAAPGFETVFDSKENPTQADNPVLNVFFVQNVTNLAATGGNNSVSLSWTYPAPIGAVVEANTGVLILRRQNVPVDASSVPADGTDPGLCAAVGTATVVFDDFANSTSFIDNGADACGTPTNGSTWFYKVFVRDTRNNYSSSGPGTVGGSAFTEEISATPSATPPQSSLWMANTGSTSLAAPALFPGTVVVGGSQSNQLFAINATTGLRSYPPVALSGAITSRSPVIDSADSSLAKNVIYVADQSGLAYAVATDTGQILWVVNPTGAAGNPFQGAGSVLVKNFSGPGYTRATDLFVIGTRNSATTIGNQIDGIDGNTGATVWQTIGGVNGVPAMDIINSTPTIDYGHTAVWVTSHSNGGTGQPSLWKLDANTGAVLASANLGDIDSCPAITIFGDALFVGSNAGTLYAIDPATGNTRASFSAGDGAIVGAPDIHGFTSPFTVIFSGATAVHAVSFDSTSDTFKPLWSTPISSPSSPLGITGFPDEYVGSNDGKIHELDVTTGTDLNQLVVDPGAGAAPAAIVGDPSLDTTLMRIYVSTSDQRMYAFTFPF